MLLVDVDLSEPLHGNIDGFAFHVGFVYEIHH